MYCLIEKILIHNSENHQRKMRILKLKKISDITEKMKSEADLRLDVFTEADGHQFHFAGWNWKVYHTLRMLSQIIFGY